jgi:hypothetical protein
MGPPRLFAGFLCLALACTASSCAKHNKDEVTVYPVSGQVLFDGKPTPGAIVILHAVGDPDQKRPNPRALVDRDGNFRLTTYRPNDGAPAGDYVATVDWRKEGRGQRRGAPGLLPAKYGEAAQSPLHVTVAPTTDHLQPFDIPRPEETAAVGP